MKLIHAPPPPCACSVCSRSTYTPTAPRNSTKSSLSFTPNRRAVSGSKRRPIKSDKAIVSSRRAPQSPFASTSQTPYSPPLATCLPPEILSTIFALARPPLPLVSLDKKALAPSWPSFVKLSLVHTSWTGAAQKGLARAVLVRSEKQRRKLGVALKEGWVVGPIRELLFEAKETGSSKVETKQHDAEEQKKEEDVLDPNKLSTILSLCGARLEILRLRGFGDQAFLSPSFTSHSAPHLPLLHTLEYSPVDSSAPPTTTSLFAWTLSLPSLRELIVSPNQRSLAPLEGVHLASLQQALESISQASPTVPLGLAVVPAVPSPPAPTTSPPLLTSAMTDDSDHEASSGDTSSSSSHIGSSLQSLTLSSVILSSPTLLAILATSIATLTSLTLSSVHIIGSSAIQLLILRAIAPQLQRFEWEDRMVIIPPAGGGAGRETLNSEEYWSIVKAFGGEGRRLSLFGEKVFDQEAAKTGGGFELPGGVEELSIGARGEVASEDLAWWLERVLVLLRKSDPKVEEEEEVAEGMAELEKAQEQWIEEVKDEEEGFKVPEEDSTKPEPNENDEPSAPNEPTESTRSSKKRRLSWSGSFSLVPPHATSSSSSGNIFDPSDPAPPPTPTLRSLSLWTVETTSLLREDDNVRDAIEEIVERGVAVTWWEMRVVLLDTLELTRELRKDMLLGEQATSEGEE